MSVLDYMSFIEYASAAWKVHGNQVGLKQKPSDYLKKLYTTGICYQKMSDLVLNALLLSKRM